MVKAEWGLGVGDLEVGVEGLGVGFGLRELEAEADESDVWSDCLEEGCVCFAFAAKAFMLYIKAPPL